MAKQVVHLPGVDERGHMVVQKRVTHAKFRETIAQLLACLIDMEACGSAQYWAREFQRLGHTVKLISPQFVKPSGASRLMVCCVDVGGVSLVVPCAAVSSLDSSPIRGATGDGH